MGMLGTVSFLTFSLFVLFSVLGQELFGGLLTRVCDADGRDRYVRVRVQPMLCRRDCPHAPQKLARLLASCVRTDF